MNASYPILLAEGYRKVLSQTPFQIDDQEIQISASFGVSGFSPEALTANLSVSDLLKRLDTYLYQAKKGSRNRVEGWQFNSGLQHASN